MKRLVGKPSIVLPMFCQMSSLICFFKSNLQKSCRERGDCYHIVRGIKFILKAASFALVMNPCSTPLLEYG